jgi:hypothetical protein
MKSRKTSSPAQKSKWNAKNLLLHSLHVLVLLATIAAHPVQDHGLVGALP